MEEDDQRNRGDDRSDPALLDDQRFQHERDNGEAEERSAVAGVAPAATSGRTSERDDGEDRDDDAAHVAAPDRYREQPSEKNRREVVTRRFPVDRPSSGKRPNCIDRS